MEWWVLLATIVFVAAENIGLDHGRASRLVYIEQGPLRAYKATDGDFFVFYGVPYATAPTGKDRYKAPLPPPVWTEPLEAIDKGIICPQTDFLGFIPKDKIMKENCLIASIYVPDTLEDNIPVVIYVHGGAFFFAFGDYVKPRNLAKTKKVIIVTFNYRLGTTGFLCLGTKEIPGNAGIKDQVALLRWVNKNIASFGGNPNDVTLAGYSAGSAAVDLLMISKMTKGLINKVIPESGVSLSVFTVQHDPLENAKRLAEWLNFTNVNDFSALQEFFISSTYEVLNSVNVQDLPDNSMLCAPCVERDVGIERFLEDTPLNILLSGDYPKLPLLYGFTTMEGLCRLPWFDVWKDKMNKNFSDFLPNDLQFDSANKKEEVAKKVKEFYFGPKPITSENILGYVDYVTDVMIAYSTLRSVNLHLKAGHDKIYFYEFINVNENTIEIPYTNIRGPDHCAQTWAVLDGLNLTHTNERLISNDLRKIKNITRELWLNFITTGNPTPENTSFPSWPTTEPNAVPHMALDIKLEIKDYFERNLDKRFRFWDDIYKEHYRQPIPPRPPTLLSRSNEL